MTPETRCKACECLLGGSTPGHSHHIIPQAFGGANGPTVDLCTADHNLLHAIGLRMTAGKPYADLTIGLGSKRKSAILWLASKVALAYEATQDDPNKRVQLNMVVSAKKAGKLDELMKIFNVSSRQAALERLIDEAHRRHFLR